MAKKSDNRTRMNDERLLAMHKFFFVIMFKTNQYTVHIFTTLKIDYKRNS